MSIEYPQNIDRTEAVPNQDNSGLLPEAQEALSKVIDIYTVRELKLKSVNLTDLVNILDNGVITEFNRYLITDVNRNKADDLERQRKIRQEEEKLRKDPKLTRDVEELGTDFSHQGNVYYPDGVINIVYSIIRNEFDIDQAAAGKEKIFVRDVEKNIKTFRYAFQELVRSEKIKLSLDFLNLMGRFFKGKGFSSVGGIAHNRSESLSVEEENEFKKIMLDNAGLIRQEIIKLFYNSAMGNKGTVVNFVDYTPDFGIVFGPNLEVTISHNTDYQTQAMIRDVNNKRHIIGLFINTKYHKLEERLIYNTETSLLLSTINRLYTHISLQKFTEILNEDERLKEIIKKYEIKLVEEGHKFYFNTLEINGSISIEDEQYLKEKDKQIFYQFSGISEGETLFDFYKRLAEKHRLPIYDLYGNLLWPKKITHKNPE